MVATQYCVVDWEKVAKRNAEIREAAIRVIASGILDRLLEGGFLISAPNCIGGQSSLLYPHSFFVMRRNQPYS
jgi:hypothetical protein